jgi:PAS domain S-box-containing protein
MSDQVDYLNKLRDAVTGWDAIADKIHDFYPAIVYTYDVKQQRIKFLNKKVSDLLGYSIDDNGGLPDSLLNIVFKEDASLVEDALEKFCALQDGSSHAYDARLNHKEGTWRYFRTTGNVVHRDEKGVPEVVLCIAHEVTDQWKSQEEIRTTRELIEGTESLLQFGSWSWDVRTWDIIATDGLYDLLGYKRGEDVKLTGEFYLSHVIDEQRDKLKEIIVRSIANASAFEFEYILRTQDGTQKVVSSKGKVVTDKAGAPQRILGITRDVTQVKSFEKERERNIRELNRSNRDLEEFAYIASHDLQEPLRKISTFGERLKTQYSGSLDKDGALYLNRILVSTDNMRTLIDNLLEFSRMTRSSRAYVPCDLNSILQEVSSDQELKIEETHTTVHRDSLPVIDAVPSEMRQLFNNLVSNSLKFRRKDVAPVIRLSSTPLTDSDKMKYGLPIARRFYRIDFSDNGIGFEQEYAEKIFQIFQRLHGKAEYPGAGIGLAICKKIVDNHEGIIYASSNGNGSTFTILLPQKQYF